MAITAKAVAELRELTGSGMMDCKRALTETDGDIQKAVEYLREKGLAQAAKKAGRIAAEGIVESYIHLGGRIGVLIEVNCETDFVAKMPEFKSFVRDLAMQVAAAKPLYVSDSEIPEDVLAKEREIERAKALNEGKPEKIVDKIVEGRIAKYKEEVCLLNQVYIKDTDKKVQQYINEKIASIGEKISVRRFIRYEMGEGLAKREDNFAEEVMKQAGM